MPRMRCAPLVAARLLPTCAHGCSRPARWFCGPVALLALLVATPPATAATSPVVAAFESPEVRAEMARQVAPAGPVTITQGGSGPSTTPAGEVVESLSSQDSNTWRAKGRPLTTRIYSSPVNYRGSDGKWHGIDSTLTAGLGGWENTANSFRLRLPESLTSGVSLASGRGSVSFALAGAGARLPSVSGAAATSREVLTATDLQYVSLPTGVEEIATLKGSLAPSQLSYQLTGSAGLTASQDASGAITLTGNQGAAFAIPAPVAYPVAQGWAAGRPLPMHLASSGSGWTLTVDTSEGWLREALAAGPVAVDPSVTTVSGTQACSITEDTPKTGYCASKEFQVGFDSTHKEHHGLLEFNTSSLPLGADILNAKLGLYVEAHSTSASKAVGVYRVNKPWTTSASWETYDGTHAWGKAGGDFSIASDASVNGAVGAGTGWYYWYPTKMVQEWANGTSAPEGQGAANEGLIVKDQTDNETANLLTIASPSASANQPYLEVAYEPGGLGSQGQYTTISTGLTDRSSLAVNVASGNLLLQSNDMQMPGVAGLGFQSARTWNGLNEELQEYGRWSDSNAYGLTSYSDGSLVFEDGSGSWFAFVKQSATTFITPAGIKGTMCIAGNTTPPCPEKLPAGTTYDVVYDQSMTHVDFNSSLTEINVQDRYGNTISQEYPKSGVKVITDTHGHKVEELYNGEGFITEIKDLSGSRATKYGYETLEGHHQLTSFTDANGQTTKYGYTSNTLTSITDPAGSVTKLAYSGQKRLVEVIRTTDSEHSKGPTTRFVYLQGGEVPSSYCGTLPRATIVRDGDWTKKTGETETEYRAFAGRGHETLYCANAASEIEKTFDAEKHESKATYDAFGNQITSTSAAPGTGEARNIQSTVYGEGGVNPLCQVTATEATASSCPARPDASAIVSSYGYSGKSTPNFATLQESPQQHNTTSCYNGEHQLPEPEKRGEAACTAASSPAGSLAEKQDQLPSEKTLQFTYEANGNVKTATDARGHTTTYKYDEHGYLHEIIPPNPLGKSEITVDADGRPEVITDGALHKETITYDKLDRITKIVYSGTGTERTVKSTFDADGNLTKREDPTGTTTYTPDKLNRLTREELPGGQSNSYEYDNASNMTVFTDSGGTTEYKHNGLNELESMTEPGPKSTTFEYDQAHRLTAIKYASGVVEKYKLEPTSGRPETITAEHTTGLTVPTLSYTYKEGSGASENNSALIQTLTETPSGAKTTYSYDQLDRLRKAITKVGESTTTSYTYELDGAGNRTSQTVGTEKTTYVYNEANELECRQTEGTTCSHSTTTELSRYEYDGAGEQTAIKPEKDTSGSAFAYNAASQLTAITPSGEAEKALAYGGAGQDDLTKLGTTTLQSSVLGLTKEEASGATSYFARTPEGLLIDQRTPSGSFNPLYDAHGDIIALVSATGKVERTLRYGPYGENTQTEGTAPAPFAYKAGYRMPGGNTGHGNQPNNLYRYGARYYDPTTGRWTQQDPLGHLGSATQGDRFLFAGSDPINLSDPSGKCSFPEGCVEEGVQNVEEGFSAAGEAVGAQVEGCTTGTIEGAVGGGIGGVAVSPFLGPGAIPAGAIGGAIGGCAVGAAKG